MGSTSNVDLLLPLLTHSAHWKKVEVMLHIQVILFKARVTVKQKKDLLEDIKQYYIHMAGRRATLYQHKRQWQA